jgi:hypothetical protein
MPINNDYILKKDAFSELSYADGNVVTSIYRVAAKRAQDNSIEPLLGTPLYKKILADIQARTVAGVYETLIDEYIIPYLVTTIEIEMAPHLNWQIRNKAVGTSSDDTITATDERGLYSLTDQIRKSGQVYKRRLVAYLCDQYTAGNLPEYGEATTDKEEISPDKDSGDTLNWSFI